MGVTESSHPHPQIPHAPQCPLGRRAASPHPPCTVFPLLRETIPRCLAVKRDSPFVVGDHESHAKDGPLHPLAARPYLQRGSPRRYSGSSRRSTGLLGNELFHTDHSACERRPDRASRHPHQQRVASHPRHHGAMEHPTTMDTAADPFAQALAGRKSGFPACLTMLNSS